MKAAFGSQDTGVRRAAVIGAGSMGGGIAAQFANAGIPVDLLDIPGSDSRNGPAEAGIARQLKSGGFMAPEAAALVRPGNVEDDLPRLAEADWIVEAIIEDFDLKRDLYRQIEAHRKPGSTVSSNTSTLLRRDLVAGLPESFARDYVISHFFNPPRQMQLLEVVAGADTAKESATRAWRAGRGLLGKTVVECRDTPGFIANRIGCYWIAMAVLEAAEQGLSVEEADAVIAAFGVPRTGVFGLLDLIGIDLIPLVWGSLIRSLPAGDGAHAYDLAGSELSAKMQAAGRFGRKSGAGFYRKAEDGSREALDLASFEYRPRREVADLPGGGRDLAALIAAGGPLGDYAWSVLRNLALYTALVAGEIAHDLPAVDTAVALGYGWREGPFRQIDRVGAGEVVARLRSEGREVPKLLEGAAQAGGFYDGTAPRIDLSGAPLAADDAPGAAAEAAPRILAETPGGRLEDGGEGLGILRITTKMGTFAPEVFDLFEAVLARGDLKALVIAPGSPRALSAGADLSRFLELAETPERLEAFLARGQSVFSALRRAPFPVVAAVRGLALGGGCEVTLHADRVVAHAEARIGLPETQLGILPGWGGCTRLLARLATPGSGPQGPGALAARLVETLLPGPVARSAVEARGLGLLREADEIVMHADDVEPAACAIARALARDYSAPEEELFTLAGPSGLAGALAGARAARQAGRIEPAALRVAEDLAEVVTGGPEGDPSRPLSEAEMHALERAAVLRMAARPETRAAMQATLKR
ncbi:3-hydroxyacyl-CoA dehydrogenase/enoyl-CoA hydratase family protein [Roseivivax sp. GX 12232]|uniref:3-hydroxyacyl-CoA dehydrogenase/enoyl-CoA hydratase family protein n=1 Tax=Roseivivax sp. GX 12232 TaxID=2900547 RepID=UPI001E55B24F|nr:3-hydroxyacyl-CoA dehydrogenase/enoyl-CoA hydratase family protein [Roseivivax sp. GX 12232]MCE0506156.1 3-hydroxyacyl-CoA dehydrogenase/enoyl-CoA hydratase family protein [Roseivivax sp. GX 12232]